MRADVPRMFPAARRPGWRHGLAGTFPQVSRCRWCGGARTHDRRIMSPARQQSWSGRLSWANLADRDGAPPYFGTYLA